MMKIKQTPLKVVWVLLFVSFFSCKDKISDVPLEDKVQVWWSSELLPGSPKWFTNPPEAMAIKYKLSKQPDILFGHERENKAFNITIDPAQQHQSVLGIGMALEGTTIHAMRKNKTDEELQEVIKAFIDPEKGIGFNMFRLGIGLSDFSDGRSVSDHPQGFYTYQDNQDGPFSIQKDIDYGKIAMIKKVQEVAKNLNPAQELTFFASAWSPPAWMKTNGNLIKGTLKPGYEKQLAKYFRNFVEAYEDLGIPISAITIQNEPNFEPDAYPGMRLSPQQETDIVRATYEEFHNNLNGKREINTKLWINDHNFEDWENANEVLTSLGAEDKKHYVDAVAFHNYIGGDSISHMSKLQKLHPNVHMQMTEHSEWGVSGMNNIQNYFIHGSQSYMYWVAMTTKVLDEHNQSPYADSVELSPTLLVEKESNSPEYYATPEYYLIGQFSKFTRPGAVRIACDYGAVDKVTAIAFKNPDGQFVCVLVNQTNENQSVQLTFEEHSFTTDLPAKTIGSYIW
jgi:glucosylceramidase